MKHKLSNASVILNLFQNLLPSYHLKKLSSEQKRYFDLLLGAFLILAVPLVITQFIQPKTASSVWYDDDFTYRKSIAITAHTASENNVYISTTISNTDTLITNGQLQSDCGDLRFTKQNGEVLPYYIVSGCNSASTVVHINFDTFPAGAQTIYFYYGNPSIYDGFRATDFSTEATSYTIGSTGSEEKAPSPVAYWKFDDATGTTAQDSTTNNNDGTLTNSPTWQTEDMCVSGKCLKFDGTNDNVDASDSTSVQNVFAGGGTVEGWIKADSDGGTNLGEVIGKRTPGWFVHVLEELAGAMRISFGKDFSSAQGEWKTTNAVINVGQWHHVAFTYNSDSSSNDATIYVDGVSVAITEISTPSGTSSSDVGSTLRIGDWPAQNREFDGQIDEVKVYNFAKTAEQIKVDYNNGASVLGANIQNNPDALNNGLVGYWKMDESSGNATDSSGNSYTGTATGTTVVAGKFGNGRSFNGTSDVITTPSISNTSTFTYSSWVKSSLVDSTFRSILRQDAGSSTALYQYNSNKFVFFTGFGGPSVASTTTVTTNTWYHVVATYDGTTMKLFVNGSLEGSTVGSLTTGTAAFKIGGDNYSQFFSGTLDETRIYNRALSPAEVSTLYNFAPGPVASYNFDENTGSTVNDRSGNANTGTWNGSGSPKWKPGKYGASGNFDGSSDYVSAADSTSLDLNIMTLSSWFKITSMSQQYHQIVTKGTDSSENYELLYESTAGTEQIYFTIKWSDGTRTATSYTSPGLQANTWYYVTATYDGDKMRIYLNGILGTTSASIAKTSLANSSAVEIGGDTTAASRYLKGQLDDVKIYNYARTQQQIIEDMTNGSDVGGSGYTSASSATGGSIAKPVGYWKFDEGYGTTANNVGNGGTALNGTLTGMASPATATSGWTQSGKVNKALVFDGTNDYVDLPSISSINTVSTTTNYTFSSWIKTSSNDVYVIRNGNTASSPTHVPISVRVLTSTGKVRFDVYDGSNNPFVDSISAVNDNQWHFITAVRNTTADKLELYIDGILVGQATDTTTGTMTAAVSADIGRDPAGSGYFNGSIDEPKIYNYALTADQVKLDMNQGASQVVGTLGNLSTLSNSAAGQEYCIPGDTTSCAAPVGRWDFDEATGTTANDSSGNANTGTWNGTGTTHWKPGKVNKAGNFNGTDDYIDAGSANSLDVSTITVSAWIKPAAISNQLVNYFISKFTDDDGVGDQGWAFGFMGTWTDCGGVDGRPFVYETTNNGLVCATTAMSAGNWYHLVFTNDGATTKIYVNGVLEISASQSWTEAASTNFNIGRRSDNFFHTNGQIDDVRVYNYARSAAQVAWDYNKGAPVGHWKMDECQGLSANDASGNSNTGTITIGASGTQTGVGTCTDGLSTSAWYNGRTGKRNYSLNFDGTDDYVSVASSSQLNLSTYSVSFWMKATNALSSSITEQPISKAVGASNNSNYLFSWSHNNSIFQKACTHSVSGSYSAGAKITSTMNSGAWYYVTCTYDGTNIRAYLNGNLEATTALGSPNTGNSSLLLSSGISASGTPTAFFNGQLDDVRIYNYGLTATQVKNLFNDGAANYAPSTGAP